MLAWISFGCVILAFLLHINTASSPAPSATRIIVPTFPGISTPSSTNTTLFGPKRRSSKEYCGRYATDSKPSGRSFSAIFANAFSLTVNL